MSVLTIPRAASRSTSQDLLSGGAPAAAVQPAEGMLETSASFLGAMTPADEMQAIAAEQTQLYQAAKKSYGGRTLEGGQ